MIKNFYYKMIELSQLKTLEIQFYICQMYFDGLEFSIQILKDKTYFQLYLDLYILKLNLNFSRRCDHQGIDLNFSIFNVNFDFTHYDIRHWDDELNDYQKI